MKIVCLNSLLATDGVTFYRAIQPLRYLESKGHTVIWATNEDSERMADVCKNADIIYLATPGGIKTLELLAELSKQSLIEQTMLSYGIPKEEMSSNGLSTHKLHIVVDFDDDIFEINPHNSAYLLRGRKEVVLRDNKNEIIRNKAGKPSYMWKSGREYSLLGGLNKKFDIGLNKERIKSQIEMLRLSDLLLTPSKVIERRLKRFMISGTTYLRPNAIDAGAFTNEDKPKDKVRLLWTLSDSHYFDWTGLYPAIGRMMKKYPNLELVTVGAKFIAANRAIPLSRWTHHGWVNVNEYGKFLSGLGCNIGIAHVNKDNFNDKKSPLKWEEYSMMGMATIASDFLYGMYIPDGCGLVYSNVEEFERAISDACEGKINLQEVGHKAFEYVSSNYELKVVGDALEKRLEDLIK